MCLKALGFPDPECQIDRVNEVLGAMPLRGASWDQVAGAASHFGCRATLIIPCTLNKVREWTDKGTPVIIAWNLGNDWGHASVIYHVTDSEVEIADPNCPDPEQTVRVLTHAEFYEKWWEKSSQGYKIRRPAMAIEREITPDGRQVMASKKTAVTLDMTARLAQRYAEQQKTAVSPDQWEAAAEAIEGGFNKFPLKNVSDVYERLTERLAEEQKILIRQKQVGMGRTAAPDMLLGMVPILEELAKMALHTAKVIEQRMG